MDSFVVSVQWDKTPFVTKYAALVGKIRAVNSHQPVILDECFDLAADPTYRTYAIYLFTLFGPSFIGAVFGEYGAGRANLEASSAGNAG
jgi:hypothetical protein